MARQISCQYTQRKSRFLSHRTPFWGWERRNLNSHKAGKLSSLELELDGSFNADFDIKSTNKVVVSKEFL